jgi:hypothetical protein
VLPRKLSEYKVCEVLCQYSYAYFEAIFARGCTPCPPPSLRPPVLALGPPPAPRTLLVSPLPSDPGSGGMSCSCSRASFWWVSFPSSTWRLPPLLWALHAPPGLRPLPGTPPSSVRIGRCPPPCPLCRSRSSPSVLHLGAPALTLFGDLAEQAVQAGGPGLSLAAFISGALRELSVALGQGNASLYRSSAYVATRAAGRTPMRGLARPSAEVVQACLALRVWVWGVWFGFALRCVALLCGVFVRLHLALFPAGGPFLPSLCVEVQIYI